MYDKTCPCGTAFTTGNRRRQYCKKDCQRQRPSARSHHARSTNRALHRTEFVGVDGEGVTREDGRHEYVLLSIGQRSLVRDDAGELTWRDIFPFLYDCYQENPQASFVGFALGYDFSQWLKGLSEERARMLITEEGIARRKRKRSKNPAPFPVYVEDWEIDLHAGKRFKIRPHNGKPKKTPWLYVCDAFPFYQSSFLAAIDPEKWPEGRAIVSRSEFEEIKRGKERRDVAQLDQEMIRYNTLENEVMARLMASLNEGLVSMGIRLHRNQWYGPGQAVAAWLRLINAPTGQEVREVVPEIARDAARRSYFGGWFEIFAHGHIPGRTYEYDINSAYPKIIGELPCLLHGAWLHGYELSILEQHYRRGRGNARGVAFGNEYTLVRATVEGSDERCGAMLHRTPHGRVLRPNQSAGWYWIHEIEAARRAGVIDEVHVQEWVHYRPCSCPPPLAAMYGLYQKRLDIGKNTPEGRAIRLVLNSCYGKMAQSVGSPKYANPLYASLITAGCRTYILDAIASHPRRTEDLLMVATDGVYFRTPHPTLPLSPTVLGAWDETTKKNLTLMLPGIYWDDETRQKVKEGKAPKLKSRGVNANDLAVCIDQLDAAFTKLTDRLVARVGRDEWPEMISHVTFSMVSAKQALARGKWETCGRVSHDAVRVLSATPETKRADAILELDAGIIRTAPYLSWNPVESTPYERRFGEQMVIVMEDADGLTPDGSVWDLLHEKITG